MAARSIHRVLIEFKMIKNIGFTCSGFKAWRCMCSGYLVPGWRFILWEGRKPNSQSLPFYWTCLWELTNCLLSPHLPALPHPSTSSGAIFMWNQLELHIPWRLEGSCVSPSLLTSSLLTLPPPLSSTLRPFWGPAGQGGNSCNTSLS